MTTTPVVVSTNGHDAEMAERRRGYVVKLMNQLIERWPLRLERDWEGGTDHLRWVRDTFAAADLVVENPKPEEPLGDYALVITKSGDVFARSPWGGSQPWFRIGDDRGYHWNDILAARVLHQGVTL